LPILARMRLYLVRHADAEPGEPDELRELSSTGREQARALGERLRAAGVHADAILTSPLLRARQTGAEVGRVLGVESEPEERLAPGATTGDLRAAIEGRGDQVVTIGHQPDCGRIAAELSGGPEPDFPAAGLAVLDLD
jgi:phosphohistidine phosphatase